MGRARVPGGTDLHGPIWEISMRAERVKLPRVDGEHTHSHARARAPEVRGTWEDPPQTHAGPAHGSYPVHEGTRTRLEGRESRERPGGGGGGEPVGSGRRAHLEVSWRERGPRTLPRGRCEPPAGSARGPLGPLPTVTARG